MNLIINATESIDHNEGKITIETEVKQYSGNVESKNPIGPPLQKGTYVLLTVIDNGCGMSEKTKNRILDPFFTTKKTGRGLGLAVVSGMLKSHHGGLIIESQIGKGSKFVLFLPISRQNMNKRT